MVDTRFLLGIIIFLVTSGFLVSEIAGLEFAFFTPLAFIAVSVLITAAIAAGNTPIIKGIAVAALAVVIFGGFFLTDGFFSAIPIEIFGIVMIPLTLIAGVMFIQLARG